jgi:hypothetical protein
MFNKHINARLKGRQVLVLFHQVAHPDRSVGGKRTTILPIKWEANTGVAGKESE